MQTDQQTLQDLGIFNRIEEDSVFHLLDKTSTTFGREQLQVLLAHPLTSMEKIKERQKILRFLMQQEHSIPTTITNGTLHLIHIFYRTRITPIPYPAGPINVAVYRAINPNSFSAIRYTVKQFLDFLKGIEALLPILEKEKDLAGLERPIRSLKRLLEKPQIAPYLHKKITPKDELNLGFIIQTGKNDIIEALQAYGVLDAWMGLAKACLEYHFELPEFIDSEVPMLETEGLFHPLLANPVPYNIHLGNEKNFLFLTGANMAGKSTFIKSIGLAVYLAHLGLGVPAKKLKLCYFDGLFSNIQITDNILHGESYFFNEVKRIRDTVERIKDGKKWLVLIDELFKGTNVQDAMRCSVTVIEGFRKVPSSLFLLSSHLYEIAEELKVYPNITFQYFETKEDNEQFSFSYQLKDGISNDRIGFLILQREGVTKLLKELH